MALVRLIEAFLSTSPAAEDVQESSREEHEHHGQCDPHGHSDPQSDLACALRIRICGGHQHHCCCREDDLAELAVGMDSVGSGFGLAGAEV